MNSKSKEINVGALSKTKILIPESLKPFVKQHLLEVNASLKRARSLPLMCSSVNLPVLPYNAVVCFNPVQPIMAEGTNNANNSSSEHRSGNTTNALDAGESTDQTETSAPQTVESEESFEPLEEEESVDDESIASSTENERIKQEKKIVERFKRVGTNETIDYILKVLRYGLVMPFLFVFAVWICENAMNLRKAA